MSANEALNALSTTDASNTPNDGDSVGSTLDDELRSIKANIARAGRFEGTATVTAAATLPVTLLSKSLPVDGSAGGSTTLTLPAAATAGNGFLFYVFKSGTQNNVIIDGNGAETIDGATTFTLSAQYSGLFLLCDGAGWGTFRDDRKPIRRESYGLVPSLNATDPTNDIDFTAGACWDTTNTNWIVVSALTKRADAAWAAGTNQGMIDTGSFTTLTTYYFWAILHTDGTTDILMSTADTWAGVTKPTGYTTGQLIHALPAVAGPRWLEVTVTEDEVQLRAISSVYTSTSLTTNVAVTITIAGQVPKLSMGRFIVQANASSPASTIHGFVGDTSKSGGSYTASGYWSGSTFGTYQVRGWSSVLVDSSQQVAGGMTWNAGNDSYTLFVVGYTFTRRFAGT